MTFEQIIQLSQAGFTAEQIAAIAPLVTSAPATPAANVPAIPAANVPATPAAEPTTADILKEISKLTSAITANAVLNSNQPAVNNQSAEDLLASIVIPTK